MTAWVKPGQCRGSCLSLAPSSRRGSSPLRWRGSSVSPDGKTRTLYYVFLLELKTTSRQIPKSTIKARPTRWISRFSQQIKVSTAPISKALQYLSDDYVCGSLSWLEIPLEYRPPQNSICQYLGKSRQSTCKAFTFVHSLVKKIQSPSNQFLLLDKLNVGKGLGCQLNGLKCLQLCELRWLTVETSD